MKPTAIRNSKNIEESTATRSSTPPQSSTPVRAPTLEEMQRAEKTGALVMSARAALRRWKNDEARRLLHQALQLHPTDAGALELAGDLFMAEGEQEKALRAFERGFKANPQNTVFEEKIALCHLDLDEVRREQERKELLEQGLLLGTEKEAWLDKTPSKAFGLSLLLPGAGQFYNDETRRGTFILGAWLVLSLLWYAPLFIGYRLLPQEKGFVATPIKALNALPTLGQGWFWLMTLLFVALYLGASLDAWRGAERFNQKRQQGLNWGS